jgi:uncharacterized membrane protein YbhN (UPF0104 family)
MNVDKTNRSRRTTLLRWGGSILSLLLLVYLLSQQGWQDIFHALAQIPWWIFGFAFLLMIFSRFAVSGRWFSLLRVTDENVTWWQSVRLTLAGLFATNFLPTTIGGDIVRLTGAVQYGKNGLVVAASLIVDRLIGMFGMLLVVPLGLIPLFDWFSTNRVIQSFPLAAGIVHSENSFIKKAKHKLANAFRKIVQAIQLWWQQPLSLLISLAFTGLHMICFFGIIWVLFKNLGDPISFGMVAGLYSFVYLVTLLPISINGYGLQELSFSVIFSQVGGASLQNSLTVALIFRTLTMLASLPGAAFVPGILAGQKNAAPSSETQVRQEKDQG